MANISIKFSIFQGKNSELYNSSANHWQIIKWNRCEIAHSN